MIPLLVLGAIALPLLEAQQSAPPVVAPAVRATAVGFDFAEELRAAQEKTFADPDFGDFHRVLARNLTTNLFNNANVPAFVVGSGGTLAVIPFREDIRDAIEGKAGWLGSFGNALASPITLNAAAGTLLLITPFTDDPKFRSFAFTVAQSRILDASLKYAIKFSVERSRPSGENQNSFPSGHTSGAFTYARLVHHYYGIKAGIIGYSLAAVVGVSRIELGKHFVSDVTFGATLGIIAAETAIRGTERAFGGADVAFVPIIRKHGRGAMMIIEF